MYFNSSRFELNYKKNTDYGGQNFFFYRCRLKHTISFILNSLRRVPPWSGVIPEVSLFLFIAIKIGLKVALCVAGSRSKIFLTTSSFHSQISTTKYQYYSFKKPTFYTFFQYKSFLIPIFSLKIS